MPYSTQTDLEDVFGRDNIRTWSNLDQNDETVDTARITKAITWADRQIDNTFRRSKYAVPLISVDGNDLVEVTDWSARLAGQWLKYSHAGGEIFDEDTDERTKRVRSLTHIVKQVVDEMRLYIGGQLDLPATLIHTTPDVPMVGG